MEECAFPPLIKFVSKEPVKSVSLHPGAWSVEAAVEFGRDSETEQVAWERRTGEEDGRGRRERKAKWASGGGLANCGLRAGGRPT